MAPKAPELFPDDTEYILSAGCGRILNITPDMVRKMRRAGQICPVFITRGGVAVYDKNSIEELAKERAEASKKRPRGGQTA